MSAQKEKLVNLTSFLCDVSFLGTQVAYSLMMSLTVMPDGIANDSR
ncbi:hypothetical protein M4951_24540 [Blastopirellula sp. J2-11]|nr:hypothetical protein [Blastopirellula sp. J2-11]UUO06502.1 hypothetical protein M4951_24540 [Blastopirellula sp. J2-11]